MPVRLTLDEAAYTDQMIANLAGNARRGAMPRWVMLAVSLLMLGFAGCFLAIHFWVTTSEAPTFFDWEEQADARMVKLYVDFAANRCNAATTSLVIAFSLVMVAAQNLATTLLGLRRHLRDGLTAKLLRAFLEKEGVEIVEHPSDGNGELGKAP